MSPSKPTFIFIPGAWCPSAFYDKVILRLSELGYSSLSIDLPSVGKKVVPATGYDDSNYVRNIALSLLAENKNVILVANSYGGWVAQEAASTLTPSHRAAGESAVVHLVLLDTLLVPAGTNFASMVAAHIPAPTTPADPTSPWIEPMPADLGMGLVLWGPDLSEEEEKRYGGLIEAQSALAFMSELTCASWKEVPTTFVIGEKDLALPPKVMHENVDAAIKKDEGNITKVVIKGGAHCPMLSHPEEVVKICLEAAGAGGMNV